MTSLDPTTRRVPPMGGLNPTLLSIELRRMLRNRRTIVFTLVFPAAMLLAFGGQSGWDEPAGSGNVAAYILASMALYGAALTAAAGGSMVALERSLGWSRQLRLTPLNPVVYILVKALVALVMGALAIASVNVVGALQGKAVMPTEVWVGCAVVTLFCTLTFAALGVFVGYVVPGENAMQVLGPGLALLSFLGGVFIPGPVRRGGAPGGLLDPDVRRRRDRPLAADPRAAVVRRRQRRRLVRALRGRCRLADEQGHGAGLT